MTMRDEFDVLLDEVLLEETNVAAPEGLKERVLEQMWIASARDAAALASFSGETVEESVWVSVWNGMKELVAPTRLPELVLQSKPVAVVDRMKERRRPASVWAAALMHGLALMAIASIVKSGIRLTAPVETTLVTEIAAPKIDMERFRPAGGGGGQRGDTPVTKGTPPTFADQKIGPAPLPMQEPKIRIEPTVEVQQNVKMASSLPQIGLANSPLVGMSMGTGRGTGLGSGDGNGIGPGSGGGTGGGPRRIGGGVSAPVLMYQVEPEFSEQARKAKMSGNVLVNLWVDERGIPSHARVLRGIGMGLDEKALEAVKQYRFKPALENGRPVLVELNVEVTFQIF
ncbi:MAG TPA: energy transducer TonB [Edaphobacter sp.]